MKHAVALIPLVLLVCLSLAGCNPPQPTASVADSQAPPPPPGGAPPPSQDSAAPPAPAHAETAAETPRSGPEGFAGIAGTGLLEEVQGTRPSYANPTPPPQQQPETEVVKAEKGVGIKGRSLDEYEGPNVTPAKVYFAAKERIAFEIQVPHALQLYEATNGESPKTHDEFMKNIIEANGIKLPPLPPGHEYFYDTEQKQLMVKRPKRQ